MALVVKNPPANAGDAGAWVCSLGPEDPLEEEMTTHSSVLAWRIPWTEEPGGLQSMGSQRVRHHRAHMPVSQGAPSSLLAGGSFWSAHLLLATLPASDGLPDVSSSSWLPAFSSLSVSSAPPASQGPPSVTPRLLTLCNPAEAPDETPRPPQGAVSLADLLCSDSTSRYPTAPLPASAALWPHG